MSAPDHAVTALVTTTASGRNLVRVSTSEGKMIRLEIATPDGYADVYLLAGEAALVGDGLRLAMQVTKGGE